MLSGERKKFGLRPARKPMLIDGLSNTVIVYDGPTPRYCHILFDPSMVAAVGKALPQGLPPARPAFLRVVHDQQRSKWVVSASYVADWQHVPLWESDSKPAWIRELRTIGNTADDTTETHYQGSASRARPDHHAATVAA